MILGLGQDRFTLGQLDPASSTAATAVAPPPKGGVSPSFFATAVAAGVTTWILTRILERAFLRKR